MLPFKGENKVSQLLMIPAFKTAILLKKIYGDLIKCNQYMLYNPLTSTPPNSLSACWNNALLSVYLVTSVRMKDATLEPALKKNK